MDKVAYFFFWDLHSENLDNLEFLLKYLNWNVWTLDLNASTVSEQNHTSIN